MDYGDEAAQVEYLVMDGEVRVSPWIDGTTPFADGNQITKLKFIKKIRNLGIDSASLSSGLENAQHIFNGVYKSGPSYVAPIKANPAAQYGYPDGYGYDVKGTMGTITWFKSEYESEATCNTTFNETHIDDSLPYLVNRTLQQVTTNNGGTLADLDAHADWSGGSGGIELAIWLGGTTDDNSEIYNYYSSDNSYEIFASNIYDASESVPVHIGSVIEQTISGQSEDKKVPMYYCMFGRIPKNPFQTGINYYYARKRDGEIGQKYLLFEVDFEKGYRKGGEKTFAEFTESNSGLTGDPLYVSNSLAYSSAVDKISGINKGLLSLPDEEPYVEKEDTVIGRLGTGYRTSAVVNRRAYVGYVGYYDKKQDAVGYIKVANDTVLKSPVNQFDYFPLDSKIDVEINDGEDIVKLASVGDKLLEFKEHTLYIINCSRDIEYLEGTYKYKGVSQPYHVAQGEGFVAWINQYGVYLYDGEQINNLLYNQVGQKKLKDWSSAYYHSTQSVIGYLPHKQTIFIGNKNGKILMYDLKSGGWMYSSNKFPTNDITNMITLNDGNLVWYEKDASDSNKLKIHRWNDAAADLTLSDGTVILETKEFTMDAPDLRKKIHSIYINYASDSANVETHGIPDGGTVRQLENDGNNNDASHVLPDTNDAKTIHRLNLKDTKTAFSGTDHFGSVRSVALQLQANGSAIDSGFEINDIQIVYREKTRK
jgi:hypothetical protein